MGWHLNLHWCSKGHFSQYWWQALRLPSVVEHQMSILRQNQVHLVHHPDGGLENLVEVLAKGKLSCQEENLSSTCVDSSNWEIVYIFLVKLAHIHGVVTRLSPPSKQGYEPEKVAHASWNIIKIECIVISQFLLWTWNDERFLFLTALVLSDILTRCSSPPQGEWS